MQQTTYYAIRHRTDENRWLGKFNPKAPRDFDGIIRDTPLLMRSHQNAAAKLDSIVAACELIHRDDWTLVEIEVIVKGCKS